MDDLIREDEIRSIFSGSMKYDSQKSVGEPQKPVFKEIPQTTFINRENRAKTTCKLF